jgi:hypothetical protein
VRRSTEPLPEGIEPIAVRSVAEAADKALV